MTHLRTLALLLATSLPFAMSAGCTSDNTSSTAQLIECNATASGPTGCHAVTSDDHAAGTCVDRDEDADGTAHDADADSNDHADGGTSTDDDGDGTADSEDSDDDNDGIDDDRDCDELPGQDNDDSTDSSGSGA